MSGGLRAMFLFLVPYAKWRKAKKTKVKYGITAGTGIVSVTMSKKAGTP